MVIGKLMMNNFIQSKRSQLVIVMSFIVIYLILLLVTSITTSLKVIEFALLTISFGFAPAFYFRSAFRFKNIMGWLLHAGVFGMLLIPFLFLFLGWLKINIVFDYSVIFILFCTIIGLLSLFFLAEEKEIESCLNIDGINKIDVLVLIIFLTFTAFLTLKNFSDIFVHWDIFTYWGLDAKYIYEQDQLRDLAFHSDVIIHRYTSFYPLYYSIIYDIYDGIYEQYAAWINIYINLLAMLLIYGTVRNKGVIHKFLVSGIILIVSYAAISIMKMFSMYADILGAFLLLLFFLILVDDTMRTVDTYWRRFTLLLLLAISFYFIKSHFIYFTVILIGIWFLYDRNFLFENLTKLIRKKEFWFSILSIVVLLVMRYVYFSKIAGASSSERIDPSFIFQVRSGPISSFIAYLVDLLDYMVRETPYLLGLWWLTLCSILFVKVINKKYIFIYLSAILIFLIPVTSYIVRQFDLQSGSLARYSALVMYLFPLAISFVHIDRSKLKEYASFFIFGTVVFYVYLNLMWSTPLNENFIISNGTLQSELTKYDKYAERILDITIPNSRILIADDLHDGTVTNMDVPSIFIRYFMMYNSVGSQYQIPTSHLYDYAKENSTDYILLLSYAKSLDHCDELFTLENDYLINISEGSINLEPDVCIFSSSEVYELGKAVR